MKKICYSCGTVSENDLDYSSRNTARVDSALVDVAFILYQKGYILDKATVGRGEPSDERGLGTVKLDFANQYQFLTLPFGFIHIREGDFAVSVIKNSDKVKQYDELQKIIASEIRELHNWARAMPTRQEVKESKNVIKRRSPYDQAKNLLTRIRSALLFWRS